MTAVAPVARTRKSAPTKGATPVPAPVPDLFDGERTAEKGRNLELKLPCQALDEVKRRAGTLGGKLDGRLTQDDQFYTCADGTRLKLRREIRHLPDGQALPHAELIRYLREDTGDARVSDYERTPVADPDALHAELSRVHGLGPHVRKGRELVLLGRTRLHLDAVAGLGTFVELELVLREGEEPAAARAELERIIRGLGLYGVPAEPRAYADLLRDKLGR
ncbi:MAG: class IV adenylate cyclase [Candidatus Delongbacteria bacterium]